MPNMSHYHPVLFGINSWRSRSKNFQQSGWNFYSSEYHPWRRNDVDVKILTVINKFWYQYTFVTLWKKSINIQFNFLKQIQSSISIHLMLTFFIRFVIFWHAQNLKNIPSKIVALEIKWIQYFSMNLWKKLFITNNFLYLLIEKIYGWTTIPNNTGW